MREGKKGPWTKNIPFFFKDRVATLEFFSLCIELADKLHLQYNKPIPTAFPAEIEAANFR